MEREERGIEKAKKLIANAPFVVFFTGAGISAESGIPTFRGSGGSYTGILNTVGISLIGTTFGWNWAPRVSNWLYKKAFLSNIEGAEPNLAHRAIARLMVKKKNEQDTLFNGVWVVTTNVDDLHIKAIENGDEMYCKRRIREIHGNTLKYYCMKCQSKVNKVPEESLCQMCKVGYMRPDVVLFGENVRMGFSIPRILDTLGKDEDGNGVFVIIGHSGKVGEDVPRMVMQREKEEMSFNSGDGLEIPNIIMQKSTVAMIEINIRDEPVYGHISENHIYLKTKPGDTGKTVSYICSEQ